jgi:hypothetical protein
LQESSANGWVIVFAEHLKNAVNTVDFHFADTLKDGTASTVSDTEKYNRFTDSFSALMKEEFSLDTSAPSKRQNGQGPISCSGPCPVEWL